MSAYQNYKGSLLRGHQLHRAIYGLNSLNTALSASSPLADVTGASGRAVYTPAYAAMHCELLVWTQENSAINFLH